MDDFGAPGTRRLRIAYVVWDWPALSQTFVLNEIEQLMALGHDVVVYYKVDADPPARLSFDVRAYCVDGSDGLAALIKEHGREVMHSPFAYPSTTLLVWPAARETGIPFTFMAGGVDVAHYENMRRNRVGDVASDRLCLGVITLGTFHRDLLTECGVPSSRIVMERQSVTLPEYSPIPARSEPPVVISIGRFIEKKGFEYLIRAASKLPTVQFRLYGYGPLASSLEQLAIDLGTANVRFEGALGNAAELDAAYRAADVFALPCVRAENGDLDGLPTVLLEAMGAGVPVVTTDAANIPDLVLDGLTGFLAGQRDDDSLVAAILRALNLSTAETNNLTNAARSLAESYASPRRTVETLLRLWRQTALDIVLVTYDRRGYRNWADTEEIIRRILRFTSVPFSLTVVDNASDRAFTSKLERTFGQLPQFRLVRMKENVFCGPASDVGFAQGNAPYVVYICSNEGFILRHGWDHQFIRTIEASGAAMAGSEVELADYTTGLAIQEYPNFSNWRSPEFAREHPLRRFRHIQGGFFIVRRDVFEATGGFNPAVPQNGMDIEYSYYLESLGHRLASIPGLVGVSTRTRPKALSLVDEFTIAVHPSSAREIGLLDAVVARRSRLCPCCSWHGEEFDLSTGVARCCSCRSMPFSRTVIRTLSQSQILQARPRAMVLAKEASLRTQLGRSCAEVKVIACATSAEVLVELEQGLADYSPEILVLDRFWPTVQSMSVVSPYVRTAIRNGAAVLMGVPSDGDEVVMESVLGLEISSRDSSGLVNYLSAACGFDPLPLLALGLPWLDNSPQGIEC